MKHEHKAWVLKRYPEAVLQYIKVGSLKGYTVRLHPNDESAIGVGPTANAAWRDAYFNLPINTEKK